MDMVTSQHPQGNFQQLKITSLHSWVLIDSRASLWRLDHQEFIIDSENMWRLQIYELTA